MIVVDILCAAYFYIFPSLLAVHENHPHARAVAMVNLLLGWTIVGWLVSLFWVLSSTPATKVNPVRQRFLTVVNNRNLRTRRRPGGPVDLAS